MRRLSLVVVAFCGACALFTDLSGLSGTGDGGVDSGGPDAPLDVAADVSSDAGADADGCALGVVQSVSTSEVAPQVTTVSATFQQPSNDGDYVVVGLNYEGACGAVSSVTDTMGDTYALLATYDSSSAALVLDTWGAHVTSADGGLDTITAAFSSACYLRDIKAVELRGVDGALAAPVPSTSAKGTGGAPNASLAVGAPSLLFAHTGDDVAAAGPGAGWTSIFVDGWNTLAEYEVTASPGTYGVTYVPDAGEHWAILAVALRGCP